MPASLPLAAVAAVVRTLASSAPAPLVALALALATVALLALLAAPRPAGAQQTIINVPSVDQTPAGRLFLLHESQLRDWGGERFWQTTHFLTYGVTPRLEVAATLYNVGTPRKPTRSLGLGWKTARPLPFLPAGARRWEPTLGAGQMLPVSLSGGGVGLWSYAQGAVRLPRLGTRLMLGVSDGPPTLFGKHTTHLITSYEQPLEGLGHRVGGRFGAALGHMALLGEWWAGRHELAEFVPGVNYHTKSLVVIVGYKLANVPGTRGDGIVLEIGRTF